MIIWFLIFLVYEMCGWLGYYLIHREYLYHHLKWDEPSIFLHVSMAIFTGPAMLFGWALIRGER